MPANRDLRLGLQIVSLGAAAALTVAVDDVPVITFSDAATFRRPRMAWPVQWICDDADKAAIVGYLQARQRDGKAFNLDGAWGTGKAWMLAGPVRYSLIDPGIWRVGPVDLIERLDVTAVP